MQDFLNFLLKKKQLTEKQQLFFSHWVQRYCAFAKRSVAAPVGQDLQDLIRCFLEDLGRQVEPWQVRHGRMRWPSSSCSKYPLSRAWEQTGGRCGRPNGKERSDRRVRFARAGENC